jgi:hypothetical protein
MGTLAKRAASEGETAVIFSGDKDLLQILDDRITVVSGKKQLTDLVEISTADFREKYGIEPCRLIDMKGLMGDASDNIPGVKGVGEKTALKFLTEYESLENLYEHIDDLPKNKMKEKLVGDREIAFLSKKLATICTEVPVDLSWEDMIPASKDYDKLLVLYRDLEFRNLLKDLEAERPADLSLCYPERPILRLAQTEGLSFCYGSDAHRASSVGAMLAELEQDPDYGEIVCRCECITKAEVLQALRNPLGVHTVTGIKYRCRTMMGRCQGGYCQTRVTELIQQETGCSREDVTYSRNGSYLFTGKVREDG